MASIRRNAPNGRARRSRAGCAAGTPRCRAARSCHASEDPRGAHRRDFAFEAARRLWHVRDLPGSEVPQLTDRQRECVRWLARGKSDGEIGEILDVSEETVTKHLKLARERYGVERRTSLAIRALFDGTLSFADVFGRQ